MMDLYVDAPWWEAHKRNEDPHSFLLGLVETLRNRQATRIDNTRKLIAIYEWGYKASQYCNSTDPALDENILAYNAAKNVIHTKWAKVCKTKIAPMPLSTGGTYSERRKAKNQGKALEAEFDDCRVDEIKEDVVLDAFVTGHGSGCAYVFSEFGQVRVEHVPIEEIIIDDAEGRYRMPRSMGRWMRIDRYKCLALYGSKDAELHGDVDARRRGILNCKKATVDDQAQTEHDQLEIVLMWHLPSGPDENDGRFAVCIDGCTLVDQEWTRSSFPFAFFTPRKRRRSFWGLSPMHDLASGQYEYERLTRKLQKAHHKMGGSHFIAPRSANVNPREIDNDQGTFFDYDGSIPPSEFNPSPVNPQTYQYHASIPETMKRSQGVSDMATSGQVPAGLSQASGKALQVFADEGDEQLLPEHRALERFTVDLAYLVVAEWRSILENEGSYEKSYRGKGALENLKIADLLDEKDPVIQVFPVSMLAKTPAAKFAQLTELLTAGVINTEQFKRLFELPDLEAENSLDTADTDIIDANLDRMVMEGEYVTPEPFDNLELIIKRAGKFYNVCRVRGGVPDDRMELIRQYIADAQGLIPPPPAPAAAPPGTPPPPDMGMPMGEPPMAPEGAPPLAA